MVEAKTGGRGLRRTGGPPSPPASHPLLHPLPPPPPPPRLAPTPPPTHRHPHRHTATHAHVAVFVIHGVVRLTAVDIGAANAVNCRVVHCAAAARCQRTYGGDGEPGCKRGRGWGWGSKLHFVVVFYSSSQKKGGGALRPGQLRWAESAFSCERLSCAAHIPASSTHAASHRHTCCTHYHAQPRNQQAARQPQARAVRRSPGAAAYGG